MTIMYTIGIILMSLAFALALYDILLMSEGKLKIYLLPILVVVGTMLILVTTSTPRLDKYYGVDNPHSYQDIFPDAFNEGYNKAIKEAVLIDITESGYILSFNGEEHFYYNK